MLNSMGIDPGILIIFLMILDIILIIWVFNLRMSVNRLNTKYRSFMKGEDGASLEKELKNKVNRLERQSRRVNAVNEQLDDIQEVLHKSIHKYGMVKYDAFEDVGGKLSFALALLDDDNSGFVLNAVHSKENCFLYLKEIVRGESYIMLGDEEIQALRIAQNYGKETPQD